MVEPSLCIVVVGDVPQMPTELVDWSTHLNNIAAGFDCGLDFIDAAVSALPPSTGPLHRHMTRLGRIASRAVTKFGVDFETARSRVGLPPLGKIAHKTHQSVVGPPLLTMVK